MLEKNMNIRLTGYTVFIKLTINKEKIWGLMSRLNSEPTLGDNNPPHI